MAAFPTTVATDSDLYIAVNATSTQLTDNPLSNSATTVNVTDATAFPTVGFISIDNEIIKYTGKTGTSFTGCTRGADGTTAVSHVQNSQVFHNVIAIHHNATKDDLIATQQFISDIIGRTSTQIKGPDGSAALPGQSFAADTDTGLYRDSANSFNAVTNGVVKMNFGSTTIASRVTHYFPDGSAASPSVAFESDTNTGLYRNAADDMYLVSGGANTLQIYSGGVEVASGKLFTIQAGTAASPSLAFATDTNTGLYHPTTDEMAVTTNGILTAQFHANQASDGVTTDLFSLHSGAADSTFKIRMRTKTSVSTSATTVIAIGQRCALAFVNGSDGTNRFGDLVACTSDGTTTSTLSSLTVSGSPASRTYSNSGDGNLKLAMGSGTYTITVTVISLSQ